MQTLIANRYRVLAELGRGGMGTVYRVADTLEHDREIALKTIQAQGAITPELSLRFKEEFRAMAKLRHPNTIHVFDYGQLDTQTQYLTMEIVPGDELGKLLEGLTLDRIYDILIQLLQALGFVHSRLFVHRDIKADNVRIRPDGLVKLMDFGLMTQLGVQANGKITGTPRYLAPEVAKGGEINASTDLYSVGCLAFEMITGTLPFDGSVIEVIKAHVKTPPPALRSLAPDVPEALERIVARLLEKDQQERYQTAAEVIADLVDLSGIRLAKESLEQKKSYLTSSVLVGRDKELKELQDSLEAARGGSGQSVFVGAPAGIGKSRLVLELLLEAKLAEIPVLHGQCLEAGMGSYEPLAQALRLLVPLSTPVELQTHGPVLAKILPELASHGIEAAKPLAPAAEKIRLNETIEGWLRDASERIPLIVFFDDLHWCDSSSLEVFNHCIRRLAGSKVLFLATFRSDEAPTGSPVWFTIEENRTRFLKLDAFNLAQAMLLIRAMLREVVISKEFSEYLFNATSGNAFFVTEVLRYLMEEGVLLQKEGAWHFPPTAGALELPVSVEATVLRRLSQLSEGALKLARVASVLGRYQDRDMLLAVSQMDEDTLFEHLDELVERQFIQKDEDRYTFPHDRVREALYGNLDIGDRQEFHQRCAEYLERLHGTHLDQAIGELAYHFSFGKDPVKAFEYLRKAGDRARAAGVYGQALESWRKAEQILAKTDYPNKKAQQVALWWDIGSQAFTVMPWLAIEVLDQKLIPELEALGNSTQARTILKYCCDRRDKMTPRLRERFQGMLTKPKPYKYRPKRHWSRFLPYNMASWLSQLLMAYTILAAAYGRDGRPQKGLASAARGRNLRPGPTQNDNTLLMVECTNLRSAGHCDEIVSHANLARELITYEQAKAFPLFMQGYIATMGQPLAIGFQGIRPKQSDLDEVMQLCEDARDFPMQNVYRASYTIYLAWSGRYEATMQQIEHLDEISRKLGSPPFQWTLYLRPYMLWQRGDFEEAQALVAQALRYPHTKDDGYALQHLHVLKGRIHLSLGDLEAAQEEFVFTEDQGRERQLTIVTMQALIGQGQIALARRDPARARELLTQARALCATGPARNPLHQVICDRLLASVALEEASYQEARQLLDQAWAVASDPEIDNTIEMAHIQAARGETHLAAHDDQLATDALVSAADLYKSINNRLGIRTVTRRLREVNEGRSGSGLSNAEATMDRSSDESLPPARWQEAIHRATRTGLDESGSFHAALEGAIELFAADKGCFLLVKDGLEPRIFDPASADPGALPIDRALVDRVLARRQGETAIILPDELVMAAGTNFETQLHAVAAGAVFNDQENIGVIYLLRNDLETSFDDHDRVNLQAFCGQLGRGLRHLYAQPTLLGSAVTRSLSDELRATMLNRSRDNLSREDLLRSVMKDCADRLRVDAMSLILASEAPEWITIHLEVSAPVAINRQLVSQAMETGTSQYTIELPVEVADIGSHYDIDAPSVAVQPFLAANEQRGALYCVRHNLDTPLGDDDLPMLQACAAVLGEALDLT